MEEELKKLIRIHANFDAEDARGWQKAHFPEDEDLIGYIGKCAAHQSEEFLRITGGRESVPNDEYERLKAEDVLSRLEGA